MSRLDPLTREQRSRQMALVRDRNTRPELAVRKVLSNLGYRYRLHPKGVPGRPDIVIRRLRAAIFVHGCFWHRHAGCSRTRVPRTRIDFWTGKFAENVARDRSVRSRLRRERWRALVIWECVSENPKRVKMHLLSFLEGCS